MAELGIVQPNGVFVYSEGIEKYHTARAEFTLVRVFHYKLGTLQGGSSVKVISVCTKVGSNPFRDGRVRVAQEDFEIGAAKVMLCLGFTGKELYAE